ncbi:LOW QUALITY PROTEIN: hypothetical protein PHMEG_00030123 [Phytophthora megakarya]|uniref:MULE transposase domain-containing protein n=1 Tax=Phytophthora megakarya TaxID=4795 RepID=A0A225V3H9_9STRA|nr:LOW QUALITY PROTEIN: hypothetical protein PHMEG_00030123 [Phytophthora megakarya]
MKTLVVSHLVRPVLLYPQERKHKSEMGKLKSIIKGSMLRGESKLESNYYRKPTWCPGKLFYRVDTMAFDYDNMVPHTCREPHTRLASSNGHLHVIWTLTYKEFYLYTDGAVRGLSEKQMYTKTVSAMRNVDDVRPEEHLPKFISLMTTQTQDSYKCFFIALNLLWTDITKVAADFDSALFFSVRDHFHEVRIVGCLLHLKQAWRRKMKKLRLPDSAVSIAMQKYVLDILTVVDPGNIKVQGTAWINQKIKQRYQNMDDKRSSRVANVYGTQRANISRTNIPLERYYREINTRVRTPHPALTKFIKSVISKDAEAPAREPIQLPRAPKLSELGAKESSKPKTKMMMLH